MLISLIPTVAFAENSENILYEEHFESETIKDEIENKQYGWSWDAAGNASDKAAFQVEENDYSYPNGGNFLRFASTDWYKSMWTVLDLQENGIYKLVQNGESQSDAKAAVSEYLSNNISVSFKAKFEADGKDNAKHEAYIRIKNAENEAIAELSTYCENKSDTGSLVLKALNNEKTEIEEYKIADIKGKTIKEVKSDLKFETGNLLNPSEKLDAFHFRNWFDAIRKGTKLNSGIVDACISTQLVQLGNIAQRVGHSLQIDPGSGRILNDLEANKLWGREYEKGWEIRV